MTLSETFDQLDWQKIASFVDQKQEENLHLDFKLVANSEFTNKADKRNLAKALSGFANSSGGILIWGIDARKNADGVDCATEIVELTSPALMVTRLNSMTGDATSPLIDGIRHKAIINLETSHGVVATLVPENDAGPFMAKLGEQRYYKRSGDSFYQMEHFDLADMFGRRQKPSLEIVLAPTDAKEGVEHFDILVKNNGRGVARHAGFLMSLSNADIELVNGAELQNLARINAGRAVVGWNQQLGVIHPNGIRTNLGSMQLTRKETDKNIRADLTIYCEGTQSTKSVIEIQPPIFSLGAQPASS